MKGQVTKWATIGKDIRRRDMVKKAKKDIAEATPEGQEPLTGGQAGGDGEYKIEDLIQKLQEKEKEAADNYDRYMRAAADLENYKKRANREKADCIKYGQENLIKDILPMVDSLGRAMEHSCNSNDFEAFREGLKLVQNQLNCCLEKHGRDESGRAVDDR